MCLWAAYLLYSPERDQDEDWGKFQLSSLVREYLKEPYPLCTSALPNRIIHSVAWATRARRSLLWRLGPLLVDRILCDETLLQPYWELEIMLTPVLADMSCVSSSEQDKNGERAAESGESVRCPQ